MKHHPREERAGDSSPETPVDMSWCLQALLELASYIGCFTQNRGDTPGDIRILFVDEGGSRMGNKLAIFPGCMLI